MEVANRKQIECRVQISDIYTVTSEKHLYMVVCFAGKIFAKFSAVHH